MPAGWSFQLFPGLWPSITRPFLAGCVCYRGGCPHAFHTEHSPLTCSFTWSVEQRANSLVAQLGGLEQVIRCCQSIPTTAFEGADQGCLLPTQTLVSRRGSWQSGCFSVRVISTLSPRPDFLISEPHHLPDEGLLTEGAMLLRSDHVSLPKASTTRTTRL